ncbi:hypothetical protein OG21DRAFT_1448754 [Imleria badia]|nr:hypothetical protein OG21DRAFT_1448754 [Imleria badia]
MDNSTFIQAILGAPLRTLEDLQVAPLMLDKKLPVDYLATLAENDRTDALRVCLVVFIVTCFTIVPHVFQLKASLAILNGLDGIITAGTGSGKTLPVCLFIPILLRPNLISITIFPLKRLQVTQVRRGDSELINRIHFY